MSSAGRVANLSGCVARPRAREIGLIGFAAQIQRSSLTGSYVMETAKHREPCESRGSRTVLGARGGESPPRDSTKCENLAVSITSPLIPPIPDIRADIDLRRFGPLPTHALQKPRRDPTTGSHQGLCRLPEL